MCMHMSCVTHFTCAVELSSENTETVVALASREPSAGGTLVFTFPGSYATGNVYTRPHHSLSPACVCDSRVIVPS